MATKYQDDIDFVRQEIEDSGEAVTWRQISDGAPADSAKPWEPGAAVETDNPVFITFLPELGFLPPKVFTICFNVCSVPFT